MPLNIAYMLPNGGKNIANKSHKKDSESQIKYSPAK